MFSPTVYLCGGINGLCDAEARDWREAAKLRLPNTIDPMRRDYRGKEAENVSSIVESDLTDIAESHCVLAMCTRPSWGTAMEIWFANNRGMPVFSVVQPGAPISPWLAYCTTARTSLDEAIDEIVKLYAFVPRSLADAFPRNK